jgi:Uma2 family endonuclease
MFFSVMISRSRDERIKRELFDRGGVREYWIADPDRSRIAVHRREGNRLETSLSYADRAELTTPLIPGFSLSLPELFKPSL